jgi:heat shock protein HslJ
LTASGTTKNAPQGDAFVLTFDTNTSMHSTTDCNTLRGEYLTSKDTIRFGAMMTTKMFCEGSQEMEYSSLLTKARFYKLQNQELLFILSDKNTVTFKQKK